MVDESLSLRIHNFFENPKSKKGILVHKFIIFLIFLSVFSVVIEFFYDSLYMQYSKQINYVNYFILFVFTVEYFLRIFTAPNKPLFFVKPLNLIDFFAVFPNYLEIILIAGVNTTWLRGIRLLRFVRLLRFSRIIRIFRLYRYGKLFDRIFTYKHTILQTITHILIFFIFLKTSIWFLELNGYWISNKNLGELFAIIGFALGIILSQKIGVSYNKFLQVEESSITLLGSLQSLTLILSKKGDKKSAETCKNWAKKFILMLESPNHDGLSLNQENKEIYNEIAKIEPVPSELSILFSDIVIAADLCLHRKDRLTPEAYDTLLHQATFLYLLLITIFIPGSTGMISSVVATYILYGMYAVTRDFDTIVGGEYDLINIDITELEVFAEN